MLGESDLQGTLRAEESRLLDVFEKYIVDVLDRYVPSGPRRRDSFVFGDLYSAVADSPPEDRRRSLITALLAAETEARGPLRLTQAQNVRLAQIFECLGEGFTVDGLPLHAVLAFDQAAGIYLQVQHNSARDRCLLAQARARHRARRWGWIKVLETISAMLCGYGYQPHRLLGWIALQLVGFSLVLSLITTGGSVVDNFYACLINYLNPLGVGDTKGMPRSAWVLFVVEAYVGAASLSVFFALLVRRWFRV
ncbi:MAG: hypothetical protein ACRDRO_04930 [Pseudonocardiaceae bacterium]